MCQPIKMAVFKCVNFLRSISKEKINKPDLSKKTSFHNKIENLISTLQINLLVFHISYVNISVNQAKPGCQFQLFTE